MTEHDWLLQEARNQTIFREMNEWSREDEHRPAADGQDRDVYLCECGDKTCSAPILLTLPEYEAIRGEPTRFAIALHHENPEIDSVVAEYESYSIVDKSFGPGAWIARDSDPRR